MLQLVLVQSLVFDLVDQLLNLVAQIHDKVIILYLGCHPLESIQEIGSKLDFIHLMLIGMFFSDPLQNSQHVDRQLKRQELRLRHGDGLVAAPVEPVHNVLFLEALVGAAAATAAAAAAGSAMTGAARSGGGNGGVRGISPGGPASASAAL